MIMTKNRVKYICYYDVDGSRNREYPLSSADVISTRVEMFNDCGYNVEIASMSPALSKGYSRGGLYNISEHSTLRLFPSIGNKGKVFRIANKILMHISMLFYFIMHIRKGDFVCVYHSTGYLDFIFWARKLLKFKLILEMQELYGDVVGSEKIKKKEIKLARIADAFIFPTQLIEKKVNVLHRPYVVTPGTLRVEKRRENLGIHNDEGGSEERVIRCIYAGTLDPRKGCLNAVNAARYLDSKYHIYILGFGSENEINILKKSIASVNKESMATVSYEGVLRGESYIEYVQSCDVGLCTQGNEENFNETSFPSKILSYLRNGLRVVSIKIPAIEFSVVGSMIDFYEENTPLAIAAAIKEINFFDGYDSRSCLRGLYNQSLKDIAAMLTIIGVENG